MSPEQVYAEYDKIIQSRTDIFHISPSYQHQLENWKPVIQPTEIPGKNPEICLTQQGLVILHNFLTLEEHDELSAMAIEEKQYAARGEVGLYSHFMCTMPFIPSAGMYFFTKRIMDRLIKGNHIPHAPQQMTINYYEYNEGLKPHTDNPKVIREWIVGFSLLSSCVIDFTLNKDPNKQFHYLLHPGTVMIQHGEVRYDWNHGISPSTEHVLGNIRIPRSLRISLQFSDFDKEFWSRPETVAMKVGSFGAEGI